MRIARAIPPRRSRADLRLYTWAMKQVWTGRMAQAAGKYGEHAPMTTVCCNACRTCLTANVLNAVFGVVAFVGLGVSRRFKGFSAKLS